MFKQQTVQKSAPHLDAKITKSILLQGSFVPWLWTPLRALQSDPYYRLVLY